MGVVEVEFAGAFFPRVLQTLLSQAGIPAPTLDALADGQLVTAFEWGLPVDLANAPNGVVVVTAPVVVRHLSITEFDAGTAPHSTPATVRLRVSALGPYIDVGADRVEIAGTAQTVTWPLVRIDVPSAAGLTIYNGAVLHTGSGPEQVVTIRLRTDVFTNILAPPANRIADRGTNWLIRVSGEAVADVLLAAVLDYLGRLSADTTVEDYPAVQWMPGVWPGEEIGWEAVSTFGILRKDACPGLFGDVDLSVSVTAVLRLAPPPVPLPAPPGDRLGLRLWLSTDVSDWDVFRCWAGSGGLGPALLSGPLALVGLGAFAGLESLIGVGVVVGGKVRGEVADGDQPEHFVKEGSGDNGTTYRGAIDLPRIEGLNPTADIEVGADGLIITGISLVVPAVHEVEYTPRVGPLPGLWLNGDLNCETGTWQQNFRLLRPIEIADEAVIAGTNRTDVPVTIFGATVTPPDTFGVQWQNGTPAKLTIQPSRALNDAVDGALYLHSSAGLVKYTITTGEPPQPTPEQLRQAQVHCAQNKVRALETAGPAARPQLAAELETLALLQSRGGEYREAAANAARAAAIYAELGDPVSAARNLIYQGGALSQAGDHDEAIAVTRRAVEALDGGWEWENLCLRQSAAGRFTDAAASAARAATLYRAAGDVVGAARNLVYQGGALSQAGDHDEAIAVTRLAVEAHDGGWEWENLCLRQSAAGRFTDAAASAARAAALYRAAGDVVGAARNLVYQGAALSQVGHHDEAIAVTQQAIEAHEGGWELENLAVRQAGAQRFADAAASAGRAAQLYEGADRERLLAMQASYRALIPAVAED